MLSIALSAPLRLCASAFLSDERICVYLRYLRFFRMNESVFICVICGQLSLCLCASVVF